MSESVLVVGRAFRWLAEPAVIALSPSPTKGPAHRYYALYRDYGALRNPLAYVSFSPPPGTSVAASVAGPEHAACVTQIRRHVVLPDAPDNAMSTLLAASMRRLVHETPYRIVLAYAWGHLGSGVGTVYKAANFLYTGLAASASSYAIVGGKRLHARTMKDRGLKAIDASQSVGYVTHRYVAILGSHKEKKQLGAALRWPVLPYPKGAVEVSRRDTPVYQMGGQGAIP